MSKQSAKIAKEQLEDFDQQVERIEDEELSLWQRQRRRWFTGRMLVSSQIGSTYMFLKMTMGKKILVWFAVKFPTAVAVASKFWAGVTSTVAGAWHFIQ